jgi:hypothetical protein
MQDSLHIMFNFNFPSRTLSVSLTALISLDDISYTFMLHETGLRQKFTKWVCVSEITTSKSQENGKHEY